ncbi:MAG: glycosyltransferase family 2 protein [Patescibacteria group bacterium]
MSKLIKELSTFLPCYNEAENLGKTARNVLTNLKRVAEKYELIIVNDGSRDNTQHVAQELAAKDQNIRIINHPVNRGYGAAFKSGLYAAKYPWISFIDADGQFDFSEIDQFIKIQKETEADLVIGYYRHRQVLFVRKLNTFAWQTVVFLLFGLKVRDIDCGFKLISKKIVDTIPKLESGRGAFISSEFLIKAKKIGYKIIEIPVHHYPRLKGEGTGSKLNVIIKSFVDLFRLWKKLS